MTYQAGRPDTAPYWHDVYLAWAPLGALLVALLLFEI